MGLHWTADAIMEGYRQDERFQNGSNNGTSSIPVQCGSKGELRPAFEEQTNSRDACQLNELPPSAAFRGEAIRQKETEPGCKVHPGVTRPLGWTATRTCQQIKPSSYRLGGDTTNYRGVQTPPAFREGANPEGSRPVARPLSVGPSVRRSQLMANRRSNASSVNIPEQRRLARQQQQMLQFKLHTKKDGKVPGSLGNVGDYLLHTDGSNCSVRYSETHAFTGSDAFEDPSLPHLQRRRTWMLLQHLVDQLEKQGRPDVLLQRPDLLQKLLHVIMPLLPLKAALGKFAMNSKTTHSSRPQGSVGGAHQPTARMAQPTSGRPLSTSLFRQMHTNAPPRSAESSTHPMALHYSQPRLPRTLPAPTVRGMMQVLRDLSDGNSTTWNPSINNHERAMDATHNAANRLSKDRDSRRASSTRVRSVPIRDLGTSTGSGGVEKPLHWYDKPRPVRAVSRGNAYTHVASRLPQGALQHRRPLKTRSQAVLLEKNNAERKPFRPSALDWATSPCLSNESMTEPVASARSGDSEDTIKSAATPSLESAMEDYPELGRAKQLDKERSGLVDRSVKRPQSLVRFTVTRDVEALPPSPRASNSDGEIPQSSVSGRSALENQRSPASREEVQSVDHDTRHLAPNSAGKRRQPPEPGPTAARRHTVAATVASPQRSTEEEKLIRSLEGSTEGSLGPQERRERRFTASAVTKFKSTAAAIKGGRLVFAGEEPDGGAKSQGITRIPLLKDIPKAREGRRATTQIGTPRNGSPLSPKLPYGAKRKTSPVVTRKLGKKGSRTFQKSSSISPRELSPPSARGRRMSAPPPRRITQAKISSTFPSRTRNVGERTSPTRISSASFKSTTRRKTIKSISAKEKGEAIEAQKDGESSTPETNGTAQHEKKDEQKDDDKSEEAPEAIKPDPEPPYPYLTLKELPALDQPLRPLSHLCELPFKDGANSPPRIDDSVTFIHVLERSERLTQGARGEATQRAVSQLCSDGPGTMLLVARWLDSEADAVESNTITASEKFPWREVVPPLFVGANKHRELLSSKTRSQFSPKELQAFLETEGFIETQGQKLQHLLETKGTTTKPAEVQGGSAPTKPRTPLDDYLDYLLSVAVDSLRARQRPVVVPKITQHSFGTSDEPESSCCCSTHSSEQTTQTTQCCQEGEMRRSRESPRVNPPSVVSEKPIAKQRCSSCLPFRGSSRAWFGKINSLGGFGFPCCNYGDTTGPPELDLFESTAMQQVRATACRMPLLPSERYLRYLRLTERCRELAALAIWLSGRSDLISTYYEHVASKYQHAPASVKVNVSNESDETGHSLSVATNPVGDCINEPSSQGFSRPQLGSSPHAGEAFPIQIRESQATSEESRNAGGQDCRVSSETSSSSASSLLTSPSIPSHISRSLFRSSLNASEGTESPIEKVDEPRHHDGTNKISDSGTLHSQSALQSVPPPSSKIRAKLRGRAAEGQLYKANCGFPADLPEQERFSAIPTTSAKSKPKKHIAAKVVSRVASIEQKNALGPKPLRPLGQAQWQIPTAPGDPPSLRDPQNEAEILAAANQGSLPTANTGKYEPREALGAAAALPPSKENESPKPVAGQDLVGSSSQTDADKPVLPAQGRIGDTSSRRSRDQTVKKQATVQSKLVASRSSSSNRFNLPKSAARRPAAAVQPERTGSIRKAIHQTQTPSSPTRLTQEAMDLLSEPQVLAEMARLCTRLSNLVCCTSASPPVDLHSGDDEASAT